MGDLVLSNVKEEKWRTGLLAKFLLTAKFIKEYLSLSINIPIFHHSNIPFAGQKNQASKISFNLNKL